VRIRKERVRNIFTYNRKKTRVLRKRGGNLGEGKRRGRGENLISVSFCPS